MAVKIKVKASKTEKNRDALLFPGINIEIIVFLVSFFVYLIDIIGINLYI